jgi:hypothetical protein
MESVKEQPGARGSRVCRVRLLWVLCMQSFPTFLQETLSRT